MKVLILGFSSVAEVDAAMKKLITESGCYLFYVVCGNGKNITRDWAELRGAPIYFSQAKNPQMLVNESDYLVMKLDASTPQWMKNLMMAFKSAGKHGTVIRS